MAKSDNASTVRWTNAIGGVKKMRFPWIVPDVEALETVGNSLTLEDWQRVLEGTEETF